jgi:hypothetical protein
MILLQSGYYKRNREEPHGGEQHVVAPAGDQAKHIQSP